MAQEFLAPASHSAFLCGTRMLKASCAFLRAECPCGRPARPGTHAIARGSYCVTAGRRSGAWSGLAAILHRPLILALIMLALMALDLMAQAIRAKAIAFR